ncbi:MAG: 4Fe-4S dicluster domain-containing protein [Spirochaetia bacterium]
MSKNVDTAVLTDFTFKDEVAAQPGGENIKRCFACGSCTLSCPVSEVEESYSPRRIIHLILLGLKEEVLSSRAIWYCLTCYRCQVRCPQEVKYPEIMRVLRKMAVEQGYVEPGFVQAVQEIDRKAQEHRRKRLKSLIEKEAEGQKAPVKDG